MALERAEIVAQMLEGPVPVIGCQGRKYFLFVIIIGYSEPTNDIVLRDPCDMFRGSNADFGVLEGLA